MTHGGLMTKAKAIRHWYISYDRTDMGLRLLPDEIDGQSLLGQLAHACYGER